MSEHDAVIIIRTPGGYLAVRHYRGTPTDECTNLVGQTWDGISYDDDAQARQAAIELADKLAIPHEHCYTDMYLHSNPLASHELTIATAVLPIAR